VAGKEVWIVLQSDFKTRGGDFTFFLLLKIMYLTLLWQGLQYMSKKSNYYLNIHVFFDLIALVSSNVKQAKNKGGFTFFIIEAYISHFYQSKSKSSDFFDSLWTTFGGIYFI